MIGHFLLHTPNLQTAERADGHASISLNSSVVVTGRLQTRFSQIYAVALPSIITRSFNGGIATASPPVSEDARTTAFGRYRPSSSRSRSFPFGPTTAISLVWAK